MDDLTCPTPRKLIYIDASFLHLDIYIKRGTAAWHLFCRLIVTQGERSLISIPCWCRSPAIGFILCGDASQHKRSSLAPLHLMLLLASIFFISLIGCLSHIYIYCQDESWWRNYLFLELSPVTDCHSSSSPLLFSNTNSYFSRELIACWIAI